MAVEITVFPYLSPRIIEIDGTTYANVSIQELYNAVREWEDSSTNEDDDSLIDAAGKESLGGGVTVGITATLQNARLSFKGNTTPLDDGSGRTCDATDANGRQLYVDDADFVSDGIVAGDVVFNTTTGEMATVTSVTDQYTIEHLPLQGYSNLGWTSGDGYQVYENIQCVLAGGNLVAVDDVGADLEPILQSPLVQVVRTSSSSATLSELDAIQYSSYGGGVSVDIINGTSGTDYPIGNQEYPVDNISDAVSIANTKGFKTLFIRESMTIDSGTDIEDFTLVGRSETRTSIIMHDNADCIGITLMNANVSGTLDGGTTIRNCNVGTINYVNGYIHDSGLYGTITLDGNEEAVIADCYTIDQDNPVVIDMGGSGQDLSMPNYSGLVTIENLSSATEEIGVGLNAGMVTLDSTITAGTIIISGIGVLADNSSGATVNTDGLISKETIALANSTHHGYAQGPGTGMNQIQLDTTASAINGAYDPSMISIRSGTGAGQTRLVYQYDGTTKTATVDRNWKVAPDTTSLFVIYPHAGREHVNEGLAQGGTSSSITLNANASSTNDAYVGQLIFIRSGTGDDQVRIVSSYDGTTKVVDVSENWSTTPDSTSGYVMLPGQVSYSGIADAVWDEQLSGHTGVGSAGKALTDAGVAGNPWSAVAADNQTPGTMGELMNKTKKWVGWLRSLL